MRSTFIEIFKDLEPSKDYDSLKLIADHLLALESPANIISVGAGEYSTIFDYIAERRGGFCAIIDQNPDTVVSKRVECKNSRVLCIEEFLFLATFPNAGEVDLLYVESHADSFQSVGFIAPIYNRLKSGCWIAIRGDYWLMESQFRKWGVLPIFRGEITIWQKS